MKQKLIRKKFFNCLYFYSLSFIKENDTNKINSYCKTVINPTIEEIKLHKNYLKTSLKKNYF